MQRFISFLLVGLLMVLLSANEVLALPPSTQASGISFSNVKDIGFRVLVGTPGNGTSRIIVVQPGTVVNETPSGNYTGNANFALAPVITTNARVVYSGTGSSVIITGLTPGTQYTVKVFEKNADGYNVSDASNNPRSNYTLPAVPNTVGSASNVTETSFRLHWTNPASGGFDGFQVTVSEVNNFSSALNWYEDLDVGNTNQLDVMDNAPTDILPNTTYFYRVRSTQSVRVSDWKNGPQTGVTTRPNDPTLVETAASICLGNTYSLTPTGPTPGNGSTQHKFKVYYVATGGSPINSFGLTTINLTPASSGATDYWVATIHNTTGLESTNRVKFTLTANDGGPVAAAGTDFATCASTPYTYTLTGNNPSPAEGEWTLISGPGTIPGLAAAQYNSQVVLSFYGTYKLRWTITQDGCTTTTDTVEVSITQPPTTASAGTDANICGSLTTSLTGNTPSSGTGLWSYVDLNSEGGTISFSPNASSPIVNITASQVGQYKLTWTITNGSCTPSTDDVNVTFDASPSTANAGTNDGSCGTTSFNLNGNNPVSGIGTWTKVSGPGTATFTNANLYNTGVSVSATGTYVFNWTIGSRFGVCTSNGSNVTIIFSPSISEAVAGTDDLACGDKSLYLAADSVLVGNGTWTVVAKPTGSTFVFDNPNIHNPFFEVDEFGSYTLRWTVTDPNGICPSDYDEVVVNFSDVVTPAFAGFDKDVCGLSTSLAANNPTVGVGTWKQITGPGTASFTSEHVYNTNVSVNDYGTYSFEWKIASSCGSDSQYVHVTFWNDLTGWTAGTDMSICGVSDVAVLAGSNPTSFGAQTMGEWTKVSGPGTVSYVNSTSSDDYNANVMFTLPGTYVMRWSGYNGPCSNSDEVTITITSPPTVTFNAVGGPYCPDNSTPVALSATPSGGTFSGNGVSAGNFVPSMAGGVGTHTLTYTYVDGPCTVVKTQTVVINAPTTITWTSSYGPVCQDASSFSINGASPSGGTYSGNGVSGTNFNPASAGVGSHTITYSYNNGSCVSTATKVIIVKPTPTVTFGAMSSVCANGGLVNLIPYVSPNPGVTSMSNGGVFSGTGVSGTNFNPNTAGAGTWTLTYTYYLDGCSNTATSSIVVIAPPTVTFNSIGGPYCATQNTTVTLSATPSGGTFSGAGVSGGSFNPSSVGMAGTYTLTYTYTSGPCTVTATNTVVLTNPPTITWTATYGPVCQNASSFSINGASPSGGTYSGNGVSGSNFNPATAGPGTHTITYVYNDGGCVSTDYKVIVVNELPVITWATSYGPYCVNSSSVTLNASASVGTGVYSGNGISGSMFNPATAGVGTHTITYTATNGVCTSTATKVIVVNELPVITWTASYGPYCTNSSSVTLNASTNVGTGVYSGNGISGSDFNPASAGPGTHTITYTATNGACTETATKVIVVNELPVITWTASYGPYCSNASSVTLNASTSVGTGSYSGNGISGNSFNPVSAGPGTHTITYTATNGACTVSATKVIVVDENPVITWTATYGPYCTNSSSVTLNASTNVGTGVYSGNGISGNSFNPATAGVGTHTITYTATNGACTEMTTKVIVVNELPVITWTTNYGPYCSNASSVSLNASTSVGTGVYSGNGISGTMFSPASAGVGTHTITYTATNGACTVTATKVIVIDELPVITWTATYGPYCTNSNSVTLNASTNVGSGLYSGNGISGSNFNPATAGVGTHTITYTVINGTCTAMATKVIVVNELPVITWSSNYGPYCSNASSVNLDASTSVGSGVYSGNGISGSTFNPATAGVGTHTITYTATNGACTAMSTKVIIVNENPVITWATNYGPYCINNGSVSLNASTSAGTGAYSGNGISGSNFNPASAGVGTHTITYTATNGSCTAMTTKVIVVNGLPTVSAGTYGPVCVNGNTFTLTGGTPSGGTYSGTGVSSGVFNPAVAGVGSHVITYTYTNPSTNCTNFATTSITVNALVTAAAGFDATATTGALTYTLAATNPSPATGNWTKVSGPGTASFVDASVFNTKATVTDYGTYTFRWTVTNGACSSYDDVAITFVPNPSTPVALFIVNPGTKASGSSFSLQVKSVDQFGNPIAPLSTVNFTVTVIQGSASFPTTVTGSIVPPNNTTTLTVTLNANDPNVGAPNVALMATDNANNLDEGYSQFFDITASIPTVQASGLSLSNWTTSSVDLTWSSNGNGDGVTIIGNKGNSLVPATHQLPGGTSYSSQTSYGVAANYLNTNSYVTYVGTGSSVTINGLQTNTQYAFKVCAYKGDGSLRSYNNNNFALNSNNRSGSTKKGAFDAEDLPLVGDNILSASHISPNPARDNVSLTIDLTKSANLRVAFFTSDGKQVLIPVDGLSYNAGRHSFNVPLKGLAAGVYSVVITADNEVIIDNVVVMP